MRAYSGRESLRCGFAHYRAFPANAEQIRAALAKGRLTVPTLAIAGGVVGDALAGQLAPITDDLTTEAIADCGHVIPEEQPEALAARLLAHFS